MEGKELEQRGELYQRLSILEESGLTSKRVTEYCRKVLAMLGEEKADLDEEKLGMFITHLAMATQRMISGQEESPLADEILAEVKTNKVYPAAVEFANRMQQETDMRFPQTEWDFLTVHLCNLFT